LLIKDNKVWQYRGERRSDPILEWTKNLQDELAVPYPDHIPGFTEEVWDTINDIIKNIKIAYRREPTKMTYFFVAIGGVFVLFAICFIYAIYESCCSADDDDEDEKFIKKQKND
jgi:hypothetical protein